jgi:serine protease Do
MMSTRKTTLFYAVLIAIASAAVGMVIASQWGLPQASSAQTVSIPAVNSAPPSGPIDATTFRNIAKAQTPMVVYIQTTARARRELTEGGGDEFLRRFFGTPGQVPRGPGGRGRVPEDDERFTQGTGTGFIIDKSGLILTNNHVVDGADDIKVSLFGANLSNPNEKLYAAKVIGRDTLTDSALIQLSEMPSTTLPEARFGDSDQMQPGDWVMAIGNPFGLTHTITVGVISALGRPFGGVAGREQNMLQTDAAINPGNSGGPLLNVRGEVVGINTAIYTDQRSANIGIGFATPINTIRDLLPQLRSGKVTRGVMGISVNRFPLDKSAAEEMGVPKGEGALLSSVNRGEPADRAGLKAGDVIIEFNGRPVKDSDMLVGMVVNTKPGSSVPVTVIRNKDRKTFNVTVAELNLEQEQGRLTTRRNQPDEEPASTGLGMDIDTVTPEMARDLELPRERGSVIVTHVERNSAAAAGGVAPNDIILEVNRVPVSSVSQVTRELQKVQPGGAVTLLVWRNGTENFLVLKKR